MLHPSNEHKCPVCGRPFDNLTSMKNHRRWHDSSFRKKVTEKIQTIWKNPEYKNFVSKKISESKIGKPQGPRNEETKLKMSLNSSHYWKGKKRTEESKKKTSESMRLFRQNSVVKKHTSEVSKQLWQNKKYREIVVRNAVKALMKRPTSYEQKIIDLIKENNLHFKYVGNGEIIINGFNPDFIDINDKKLLIETYCKFWHPKDYVKRRYAILKRYGFRTLFLNDDDLSVVNWKEICLNKIKNFQITEKVS